MRFCAFLICNNSILSIFVTKCHVMHFVLQKINSESLKKNETILFYTSFIAKISFIKSILVVVVFKMAPFGPFAFSIDTFIQFFTFAQQRQ